MSINKSPRNNSSNKKFNTLDRNISNASIVIGGASTSSIPVKTRPKTGVNNLGMRGRRLLKPAPKLNKHPS